MCLAGADEVVLAEIFKSEAIPAAERLDPQTVLKGLRERETPAQFYADADAIVRAIAPRLRAGDVVAVLSNGGFGGIYDKLPAALAAREAQPAALVG